MSAGSETFRLVWCDREIEVSFQASRLNFGHWHIELRCPKPLPITQTGYRSSFISAGGFSGAEDIQCDILNGLDAAAQDRFWQEDLQDSKQLKLI